MKRRDFFRTTISASAVAGLTAVSGRSLAAPAARISNSEFYELRAYRLKAGADRQILETYLASALIPALNRMGSKPVGAFLQQDRTGTPAASEVRDPAMVFVLIPYSSLETFGKLSALLEADERYQTDGKAYLQAAKANPAFERIDSWLLRAFDGMPKLELPPYSVEKKARMFEIRTYESFSEVKALKKIAMFNSGEIDLMREIGMGPIFFGQAIAGKDLPHLTYMLSAENSEAHKKHWEVFIKHPVWIKMKNDPQYADTVSRITNRFLVPAEYSQI